MQEVLQGIVKAAQSSEPVLITGETGTGKEVAARAICQGGQRRKKPFIPVDCCTLVPSLIETELFGYVRGAFTGAMQAKTGIFESAKGGTLFLDEIGELPVDLQSKLLRAIQERQIRPVGGTRWVDFDARIITATNRNLTASIQQGTFRQDLFFRLNVLTIEMPPLRQHREDIPQLAEFLLEKSFEGEGERPELSGAALDCLMSYDWPGNVRELENCMRWVLAWSSGPTIHPEDLPTHIRKPGKDSSLDGLLARQTMPFEEIERQAILQAVANANGKIVMAARILGIGKTTIYRKLKEYGVS